MTSSTTQTAINTEQLDRFLEDRSTPIARDLKLNLKKFVTEGALAPIDALLALLATASSVGSEELASFARGQLRDQDIPAEHVQEAAESAAMMGILNTYYRFRHMITHSGPPDAAESYRTAGLRMTALSRPALGKTRFEMLAFAVSVLGGCETCIVSHEKVLREAGVSADQVHDLARIASVVRGLKTLSAV